MNISALIKTVEAGLKIGGKFCVKHLPTILTAVATIGVIDATIRTARKAPEAKEAIQKVKDEWEDLPEDQKEEKAVYYWRLIKVGAKYFGVIVLEVAGVIVAMWTADRINVGRTVALTAALAATSDQVKNLEEQIKKDGGEGKLTKIKDQINAEKYENGDIPEVPFNTTEINHTIGETPIWDPPSRSWYPATTQQFLHARDMVREDLYDQLVNGGEFKAWVPHSDFLNYAGLTPSGPSVSEDSCDLLGYGVDILTHNISKQEIREECNRACDVGFTALIKDQSVGALCAKYSQPPKYKHDYA